MNTKQFIAEHLDDDVHDLALKKAPPEVDVNLALQQITARQLLRKKVPSWSANDELLFPPHIAIEQCSSEATAQYKASLLQGDAFTDLTGGLGVDCYFISQGFQKVDYVERNHQLCEFANNNFAVLKATNPSTINVLNESTETYLSHCDPKDCFLIDPARRDIHGRKTVSIADCTPNVIELQEHLLQKAKTVMVKLSPMLDITQALAEIHRVKEVHVVAVDNECKELLLLMQPDASEEPTMVCVNLSSNHPAMRFTIAEEQTCEARLAKGVQSYLYEPNAALMKGGCFKLLTQRYPVLKLHRHSHLYTSEQLVADFPGRVFSVEGWAPYHKNIRHTLLADIDKASMATRNFPMTVAELRKALRITDGDAHYLFATTLVGEQKIMIRTRKLA